MPGTLPFPGEIIGYRKNGVPIRLLAGGDPTHDLTGQLETRRASLITANRDLLTTAAAANDGAGRDLNPDEETRYQANRGEIEKLAQRLEDLAGEQAREQRAAAARADGSSAEVRAGGALTVTSEPMTYGEHSGHSYWADLARDKFGAGDGGGGLDRSRERLGRHAAELRVELPKRQERRE